MCVLGETKNACGRMLEPVLLKGFAKVARIAGLRVQLRGIRRKLEVVRFQQDVSRRFHES